MIFMYKLMEDYVSFKKRHNGKNLDVGLGEIYKV